ncbi:MAG: YIP1 family protein [Dehalococcoidia bacterium]|nr:YIP1 family protein [Dehalococcoidia bacterium]
MDPNLILNRVMRLARLDTTVFDEVRDDQRETLPAVIVAVVAAFLAGLGAFLWTQIVPDNTYGKLDNSFVNQFILGSIFLAVMYGVAALVAYVVLAQMYKVQADLQAIIRTMGYAAIPLAASLLMLLPIVFPVFAIVPMAALFVMMIYALQSATGADSNQVVMSALIGFAVMVLVCGLIAVSTDLGKAPMGAGIFGILFDLN